MKTFSVTKFPKRNKITPIVFSNAFCAMPIVSHSPKSILGEKKTLLFGVLMITLECRLILKSKNPLSKSNRIN